MERVSPPWSANGIFTEEDLRQAQQYYFQTHATSSKLIAEGRQAQGIMKSYTRHKLEREMGEDFKMYTGHMLGSSSQGGEDGGIRGEMNNLIRSIYDRVAPNEPITSPLQEDAAILRHPHGALEVCYGMVFFYSSLNKKHLTLASNRRKILKSILDEELFKWIWRMSVAYMLSPDASKNHLEDHYLSAGLPYIPAERRQAPLPAKLVEVGSFLLGQAVSESHVRFPLGHYFVTYLHAMQSHLLSQPGMIDPEAIYNLIAKRRDSDPFQHVLEAVDVLMNMKGTSSDSFDDILKDTDQQIVKFIPPQEVQFIRQFDPFADPETFISVVQHLIPVINKEEVSGTASVLPLRLLLVMRALRTTELQQILEKLPIPMLVLLRNRIVNGPEDPVGARMTERLRTAMETRSKKGEAYVLQAANRGGIRAGADEPQPERPAKSAHKPAHKPAARPAARPAPAVQAAPPAPEPVPEQPAPPVEPAPVPENVFDQRLIISWRLEEGKPLLRTLSAGELIALVGAEARVLAPWVVLAAQTGQVFHIPSAAVTKETVEKLTLGLLAKAAGRKPRLPKEQINALANAATGTPAHRFLNGLIAKLMQAGQPSHSGPWNPVLESLIAKFGAELGNFISSPSKEEYREHRLALTPAEKQLIGVLQRLSRLH